MNTLELLIFIAGLAHFGVLIASALVPQVLNWKAELARVSPLTRQLVWTHGIFIVLVIIGFGLLALTCSALLAAGDPLARAVCGFIAIFWGARVSLQYTWFDARAYLTKAYLKVGYHALTLLFIYFTVVFGYAALR